jgi:hypothetical protein
MKEKGIPGTGNSMCKGRGPGEVLKLLTLVIVYLG